VQKYYYLLIFFCFSSYTIFSQQIKGIIKDETNTPIHLANVQLLTLNTNKIISFTQTNEKGEFILKLEKYSFPYIVKITHINYEKQEFPIDNLIEIKVVLKPRITELKEVILEFESPDIIEKKDTLIYNLKNLLVGSELKLKDVIDKLPGLTIDNNKKIRFNGNKLDNILINGDEFFRENHQLATENITVDMIEKIELLKNYQDLSSIEGFENSSQTALNIKLKKSFRETFRGNFDAEGGIKERFKLQSNLFNFGSKTKFSLIANTNNLNENVFSPIDYLELRKVTGKNLLKDKLILGREVTVEKDIPPFLFAQDNIQQINSKNFTLNFTRKPTKNKRIEFVSILNETDLNEKNSNFLTFLDGNSSSILDNYTSIGNSLFSSNVFKFENKLNEKSYFQTNAYFFLSVDNQNQDLNNLIVSNQEETIFKNKTQLNSAKGGFNAQYKTKYSEKLLFEAVFFNDYNFSKSLKDYQSSQNFIGFDFNENQVIQNTNFETLSFGIKTKATLKLQKNILDFKFISTLDNETLSNKNNVGSVYNFSDNFLLTSNSLSTIFTSDTGKKLRYTMSLELMNNNHEHNRNFKETINVVLPSIHLSYRLSDKTSYSLGYNSKLNSPTIYNFISGNLIENQRTLWLSSNLISEKMLADSFNTGFFYTDVAKSLFSNLFLSYSENRKQLVTNSNNSNSISIQEYQYIDFGNTLSFIANFSKKFKKIPLGLNFSSNNSISKNKTLSNNTINNNSFNQNNIDFSLKSYFKNKANFDFGLTYLSNFNKLETLSEENKNQLQTISPLLKLDGTFFNKKMNWKINTTYHVFESSTFASENILDIGARINYTASNKINIYLNANNVLNIRENNFKNDFIQNDFMIQEIVMNTLSGFVNLGFTYSF
jgi:hypothetical protein